MFSGDACHLCALMVGAIRGYFITYTYCHIELTAAFEITLYFRYLPLITLFRTVDLADGLSGQPLVLSGTRNSSTVDVILGYLITKTSFYSLIVLVSPTLVGC